MDAVMGTSNAGYDAELVRAQFPILDQEVRGGRRLVYLDNAATSHKPRAVIEALDRYYERDNSNVHRAVHALAGRATEAFDAARGTVQRFLGAESEREIVFTTGTTMGINLVAQTWGRANLGPGDRVVVSEVEHHSGIVPWQLLAAERGFELVAAPVDDDGQLRLDALAELLTPNTKLVGMVHASNALGSIFPVESVIQMAHDVGARVLLDGAQAVPHMPVDVRALDVDFYVFSGHKVYAPTGTGALYGKLELLQQMPPWQGGGDMIDEVSFAGTTYAEPPARFEAGTPNIAGAIGLAAALDWVESIGRPALAAHETELLNHGTELLRDIDGLRLIGTAERKVGVLSFVIDGAHAQDVGTLLDMEGVAVRTGHHCAQPAMRRFGVDATVRASLAAYNTHDDLDRLAAAIRTAKSLLL